MVRQLLATQLAPRAGVTALPMVTKISSLKIRQ